MRFRFSAWITAIATAALTVFLFVTLVPMSGYRVVFSPYIFGLMAGVVSMAVLIAMIIRTRARNATAVWFVAIALTSLLWSASLILFAWSATPETAQFWQHLLGLFWVPIPIYMFLLVVSYIDDDGLIGHPVLWISLPIVMGILVYVIGYGDQLYYREPHDAVQYYWGIESALGRYSDLVFAWLGTVSILALVMLIIAYRKTSNVLKKKQTAIFILAVGQFIAGGVVFDIFYYYLTLEVPGLFMLPPMTFVYTALMAIIIGYGIIRYGVFKVNPASLSGTILENLLEAVVAVNNDLEIEFTNKGTNMITGFQEETLKGQHISMLFDTHIFQQIKDKLQAGSEYFVLDDTTVKHNTGALIPITLSVGSVYDERKGKAGSIFVFANISELKRKTIELEEEKASVEEKVKERTKELSEERARLSASINSLRLGYLMTGIQNEIVVMNPSARTLLAKLAELQQIPVPERWDTASVQKVLGNDVHIDSAAGKESEYTSKHIELKEVRVAERFLYVFISPVTRNNEAIGRVVLFEDITDERALKRSKEEFFTIASHELRTPLTKIHGSVEVIRDVYKTSITSEDALKMLQEIESSSSHLIDIINIIIEITELEQGKVKLMPEPFDIREVCQHVLKDVQARLGKEAVEARFETELQDTQVVADKNKTEQIIRSFVSNAFKFTEEGSVTLRLERDNDYFVVRITDTGKGIEDDNKSLLFRKFQQAGSSLLSRDGEGTGLGLYAVKLIAKIMNAKVGLEHTEVGKGSTFYFKLPAVSRDKQA